MTFKKKALVVAAAGALTAATAVPALALENEFHGMFRLFSAVTNFNQTPLIDPNTAYYEPAGKDKKAPTAAYFAQRGRLMYIAKASNDLKLVTHFEIDSNWGDAAYANGRSKGAAIGADTVNLETKSVYLDFNVPSTHLNFKVGIQPLDDAYKGVVVGADAAGVLMTANLQKAAVSAGYFRFKDAAGTGKKANDFFLLDAKCSALKNTTMGASYYLYYDDTNRATSAKDNVHMLGLNGETTFGQATIDGFFLYQTGKAFNKNISAFAANVGGRVKAGTGTARSELLYVSGEGGTGIDKNTNGFLSGNLDYAHGFYNSNLQILGRDAYSMTIDNSIVLNLDNKQQGLIQGSVGYDLPITKKMSASANAGFAAVAKDNSATRLKGVNNKSNYLGTEINASVDYKLYENLTVIGRGAYVMLGDYFKGVAKGGANPDNPYLATLIMNYTF